MMFSGKDVYFEILNCFRWSFFCLLLEIGASAIQVQLFIYWLKSRQERKSSHRWDFETKVTKGLSTKR